MSPAHVTVWGDLEGVNMLMEACHSVCHSHKNKETKNKQIKTKQLQSLIQES